MHSSSQSLRAALGLVVGMLCATGCDDKHPKRYAVSGSVRFENAPLPFGSIRFIPTDLRKNTDGGAVIQDGKFSIPRDKGLFAGTYRVVISAADEKVTHDPKDAPGPTPVADERIPVRYSSRTKTILTIEISPDGENVFPFDLK